MEKSSVEAIVRALNQHQVRYLIVGGLAVVAHGYMRFTADIDLVLAVDRDNLTRAVEAIKSLDYLPRVPVAFEEFIEPANRRRWASERNMLVFSLYSTKHQTTAIDLFLDPPVDFDAAYSRAVPLDVASGIVATFCSLEDLITMKTFAGRPRDLEDIAHLRERKRP
jgi:predicted nucleotidyltransferase